jgi:serine O-acetyltransferase
MTTMDGHQEEIIGALLASYQEIGGINHVDCGHLPSKEAVAELCQDLLHLLFPGYYSVEPLCTSELRMATSHLVGNVSANLRTAVERSLTIINKDCLDNDHSAAEIMLQFLRRLPDVRKLLLTDVQAAFDGDPAAVSYEEIILAYPGLEAIAIQRMAHELYLLHVPLLPRMMTEWAHSKTGIDIHPGAKIGSHFFIDHGTGVVIGETCEIGSHVKLYQGVGLVARSLAAGQALKGRKRHPTIEDHTTIYAGATIVGGDTIIGARSIIGANVFLMVSVEPDMIYALGDQEHRISSKRRPA